VPSHKDFARRFIIRMVRMISPVDLEIIPRLEELYPRVKLPPLDIDNNKLIINYTWTIGYFDLVRRVDAPSVRLPQRIRSSIASRLDRLGPSNSREKIKRCALYLRQKEEHSADYHNSRRCGSRLTDYLAAIRFLNARGYQVLVTGDVDLPHET